MADEVAEKCDGCGARVGKGEYALLCPSCHGKFEQSGKTLLAIEQALDDLDDRDSDGTFVERIYGVRRALKLLHRAYQERGDRVRRLEADLRERVTRVCGCAQTPDACYCSCGRSQFDVPPCDCHAEMAALGINASEGQ